MPIINVIAAAQHTGQPKSTLDKYRVYGGGPLYLKIGARVYYDTMDLDSWLASKKVANTSEAQAAAA